MAYNFKQFEDRLGETKEWFVGELSTIRTGRATITLLDGVKVDSYGSYLPINQVAGVANEDAKTLRITPYDKTASPEIEKAINNADLGVSVTVDDGGLRVIFPDLTSERRDLLIKQAGKKLEEAKISIRKERDEIWSDIQKQERDGEITEDEKFKGKEDMQKIVDELQKELDGFVAEKETEIRA
jgi:ribosome recycling factor